MRLAKSGWAIIGSFGLSVLIAGYACAQSASPESGVWQKHQYSFAFLGFTSTYSCDGLASKLKLLLQSSGARSDIKATAGACASGFGQPDKFARSDITFYSLAPPPTDNPADNPADSPPVNAEWRTVALARNQPRDLATGDCELVEQFKTQVLPMFTTRNIDSHTTCIPHQESGSLVDLRFDVLAAQAHKPDAHSKAPAGAVVPTPQSANSR